MKTLVSLGCWLEKENNQQNDQQKSVYLSSSESCGLQHVLPVKTNKQNFVIFEYFSPQKIFK